MHLDHSTLIEKLHYEPTTGHFTHRDGKYAGQRAGGPDKDGYRRITINHTKYRAARLAWFYIHGTWPEPTVDHINGNRDDDRIANLRPATRYEQKQNGHGLQRNNTTGYPGVIRRHKRYEAQIRYNGKARSLGTFETPEQAHAAYTAAKRELHPAWAP